MKKYCVEFRKPGAKKWSSTAGLDFEQMFDVISIAYDLADDLAISVAWTFRGKLYSWGTFYDGNSPYMDRVMFSALSGDEPERWVAYLEMVRYEKTYPWSEQ